MIRDDVLVPQLGIIIIDIKCWFPAAEYAVLTERLHAHTGSPWELNNPHESLTSSCGAHQNPSESTYANANLLTSPAAHRQILYMFKICLWAAGDVSKFALAYVDSEGFG